MRRTPTGAAALAALLLAAAPSPAATIPVLDDVMTSGFFTGVDLVRGYPGDDRDVHRVSTDGAFGVAGAETIYVTFDPGEFSGFTAPVASATLTLQSASGGFGADADSDNPLTVSAHAVDSDPLTSIADDTNPDGATSWLDFYENNILPAHPDASTVIDSFGAATFDVTAIVNDWLSGANSVFAVAMTGKNDASGADFLHGFLNNSESPGSTFLTVTLVPEPASVLFVLVATPALAWVLFRPSRGRSTFGG